MQTSQTKTGLRIQNRIESFLANPVESVRKVQALRGEHSMAKARRKATPKQMAALKLARAALTKKYGTANIGEIAARRGSGKKRGPRRSAAAAANLSENVAPAKEEETMQLEENPKKRAKKAAKKKAPKKAKAKSANAKTARRAAPKQAKKAKRKAARRPVAVAVPAPAPKKRRKRRSATQKTVSGKVHVVRLPRAPQIKVIRIEEKPKRKRRKKKSSAPAAQYPMRPTRSMLENPSYMENPYEVLFENPEGPFSMSSMKSFAWAAGGVAFGLTLARGVDRFVATRAPAKSGTMEGNNPWFGRDAAAAMHRRPDAIRMGVQGLIALSGVGGAYLLRDRSIAPWMLGGLALGAASNLLLQVVEWQILPRLFKVEKADEQTLANRLYPVEQIATQDTIDGYFEKWDAVPSLAEGQQNPPIIQGVLSDSGSVYTLGEAGAYPLSGAVGHGLIPTGRVGQCQRCGGNGGCFPGCQSMGGDCQHGNGGPRRLCEYIVQTGDNLDALLASSNTPLSAVDALNSGTRGQYWVPGTKVILPFELCMYIDSDARLMTNTPVASNYPDAVVPMGGYGPGSAPGASRAGPGSAPVATMDVAPLPSDVVLSVQGIPEAHVYVPNDEEASQED